MSTVSYPHIEQRQGTLYIAGTLLKIRQIALDHVAYGWDAAEIQRQRPQLTLGQIHAALSYFYDHRAELERELADGLAAAASLSSQQPASSLADKAEAAGKELP